MTLRYWVWVGGSIEMKGMPTAESPAPVTVIGRHLDGKPEMAPECVTNWDLEQYVRQRQISVSSQNDYQKIFNRLLEHAVASGIRPQHVPIRFGLKEAGLDVDPDLVPEGHFTFESGLVAMSKLLENQRPPTAVFAANDDMAAAAVALARSRNITVPDQMSIAGFDDTSLAVCVFPALTTVHQPVSHMAEQAIEHLVSAVRAGPEGRVKQTHVVPHRLVFRGSTGPVSL